MHNLLLLGYSLVALSSIAHGFYTQPSPVWFSISPSDVISCEDCGPIQLTCAVMKQETAANLPDPVLNWRLNNTQLPSSASEIFSNETLIWSTLTISQPTILDSGLYQCTVTDGIDSSYCEPKHLPCVTMVTLSNPAVVEIIGEARAMEIISLETCSSVLLSARVSLSEFVSKLTWLKDGSVINSQEGITILHNGDLALSSRGDTNLVGSYTALLSLSSQAGQNTNTTIASYNVQMNSQKEAIGSTVQISSPKETYFTNEPLSIVCLYNTPTQGSCPSVQWQVNGSSLPNEGSVLLIKSSTAVNTGNYCCSVDSQQDCLVITVLPELGTPAIQTQFLNRSTTALVSSELVDHPLIWFYNGVEIARGSSINASDFGIYQSFIATGDQFILGSLLRIMPYGLTNPIGMLSFTQPVRAVPAHYVAMRLAWDPPLYTGGLSELKYRISELNSETVNFTVQNFFEAAIYIPLEQWYHVYVVDSNDTTVSERNPIGLFFVVYIDPPRCSFQEVLYPPLLGLACDGGLVNISLVNNSTNLERNSFANFYIRGSCIASNNENSTIMFPVLDNNIAIIDQLSNGTWCELTAAATPGDPTDCSDNSCSCWELIEYSQYQSCTVTGTVRVGFNQSSLTVRESAGNLSVCITIETSENISNVVVGLLATPETAKVGDFGPVASELNLSKEGSCVDVSIIQDGVLENDEEFSLQLWSADPMLLITSAHATVTIINTDVAEVSLSGPTYVTRNNQSVEFSVCISTPSPSERSVVFTITTVSGSYSDNMGILLSPGLMSICLNQSLSTVANMINISLATNDSNVIITNGRMVITIVESNAIETAAAVVGILSAVILFTILASLLIGAVHCYCRYKAHNEPTIAEKFAAKYNYKVEYQLTPDDDFMISTTNQPEIESDQDSNYDEYHSDSETVLSIPSLDQSPGRNRTAQEDNPEMKHHTSDSGMSTDSNYPYVSWRNDCVHGDIQLASLTNNFSFKS